MTAKLNPTGKDRLVALDALRGIALLGIVLVNAVYFAMPLTFAEMRSLFTLSTADQYAIVATSIFAELKFISIFSMLFGVGLAIQYERSLKARAQFFPFVYRRLCVLGIFGLAHGIFLWYGDVLFTYACVGSIVVLIIGSSPKDLIKFSLPLLFMGSIAVFFFSLASSGSDVSSEAFLFKDKYGFDAIKAANFEPANSAYIAAEKIAHAEGPYLDAMAFRSFHYVVALMISTILCWTVSGMFCIGAALWKTGFFNGTGTGVRWRKPLLLMGLLVGFPLEVFNGCVREYSSSHILLLMSESLHMLSAPLMALGIVSACVQLVERRRLPGARYFAAVGRMSLTAYLLESVFFVFVTDWWGLGLFGKLGPAALLLTSVLVYTAVVVFCTVWQRFFTIGPMERLWRSLSYMRVTV